MRILFYYPSNKRTVALETKLVELKKRGYEIMILTTCPKGDLHTYLESLGFETFIAKQVKPGLRYYAAQVSFLVKFCKKQKIDLIFSHLQHTNFIAVMAAPFIKAKVITFRHHFRYINPGKKNHEGSRNEKRFDRMINRFSKKIIVPSKGVYDNILLHENVPKNKLQIIPYIYDFSMYQLPDEQEVKKIIDQYPCKLRLIMVSRLIQLKQHQVVFPVINKLVKEGLDIKMLVLDEGPEKENLERYIAEHSLEKHIIMPGFRKDFVNYMAACDLLVQPSLTDASNSAAKEMALFGKPIAVSTGVGDYDDYVRDHVNGFLIPVDSAGETIESIIREAYEHPQRLKEYGLQLKNDVISRFDRSPKVIEQYIQLIHENVVRKTSIQ